MYHAMACLTVGWYPPQKKTGSSHLNRTVFDSVWIFYNLCGSHLQRSQIELYYASWDGIKLWLLTWLVNQFAMSLIDCLLSGHVKCLFAFQNPTNYFKNKGKGSQPRSLGKSRVTCHLNFLRVDIFLSLTLSPHRNFDFVSLRPFFCFISYSHIFLYIINENSKFDSSCFH